MLKQKYATENGRPINEVFCNLGVEKAEELYNQKLRDGLNPEDAWLEVYSMECSMDENKDGGND